MPSINMIAPRRAEKHRLEMAMRKLVAVILVELVLVVAICGWGFMKMLTTGADIKGLDAQLLKLRPKIKEIEKTDKKTAELKPKLDLLNQAKDGTMRWYNTLDQLTLSMPQSTWLTRFSTSSSTQGSDINLSLNGISVDQSKVGETMMRLHNNPNFKSVDLHYTQKTDLEKTIAVEFEIGAAMSVPETTDNKPKEVTQNGSGQS
jgi:Tfp pilus assembly protein PilN